MKVHLPSPKRHFERFTACGRDLQGIHKVEATSDRAKATCRTCLIASRQGELPI